MRPRPSEPTASKRVLRMSMCSWSRHVVDCRLGRLSTGPTRHVDFQNRHEHKNNTQRRASGLRALVRVCSKASVDCDDKKRRLHDEANARSCDSTITSRVLSSCHQALTGRRRCERRFHASSPRDCSIVLDWSSTVLTRVSSLLPHPQMSPLSSCIHCVTS